MVEGEVYVITVFCSLKKAIFSSCWEEFYVRSGISLSPNMLKNVNLESLFLFYKQYNSYNNIYKAYDYIQFTRAINVEECAKGGQGTLRNRYKTNGPAQPARKKNVVVDKFFAPRNALGSRLTSSTHPLELHVEGRILLTSALSDLSISAEYLCHLLIALSVK